MLDLNQAARKYEGDVVRFAQDIVRIRSYSGEEGELARFIRDRMLSLGYDEVFIDAIGNVAGRMGNGPTSVMLDSHMDTVEAADGDKWSAAPFGGEIRDGRLYGRGAVDMKGALASSVFAPLIARDMGWLEGRTVYIIVNPVEKR